jgi:hypothetical protein
VTAAPPGDCTAIVRFDEGTLRRSVTQPDRTSRPGRLWRLGLSQSPRGTSIRRPGARQGVAVTVTAAPTDSEGSRRPQCTSASGTRTRPGIVRAAMGGAACGGSHCGAPAGDAGGPTEEDAAHARLTDWPRGPPPGPGRPDPGSRGHSPPSPRVTVLAPRPRTSPRAALGGHSGTGGRVWRSA